MLQSTVPERLNNKASSMRDAWMSLERRKRIDFIGRLKVSGDEN